MKKVTLSVIIPTYNRYKILKKILNNLSFQKNINFYFEILVCDSSSKDETPKLCKMFKKNKKFQIKYLNSKINNLSAKRNMGIKYSSSDKLIFIDDDCIPEKNFLSKYNKKLNIPQKKIFCGIVKYPLQFSKNSNYLKYRQSTHFLFVNENKIKPENIVVMNMGLYVDKKIKNKIYFNQDFTGYGFEDYEFANRMIENNFQIFKINSQIIHFEKGDNLSSYLRKIYNLSRYGIQNLKKVNYKYFKKSVYYKIDNNLFVKIAEKLIFYKKILNLMILFFVILDKNKIIKSKIFYRLVILFSYLDGKCDRQNKFLKNKNNWYE